MGFEPANIINRTTGYDKTHAVHTTAFPGARGTGTRGQRPAMGRLRLGQNGSMPRSNRPRRSSAGRASPGKAAAAGKHGSGPVPELDLERARAGIERRESAPDGVWMVRTMTARNAEKAYICPGCSTAVLPGVAHLVVWADDHLFGASAGLAERRHWHTNCWTSRNFRYR
jgi:hypothetical protein